MPDTSQTIVLKVLNGRTVSKTYIFAAVGDINVVDAVELSTEPGVMGRIGPKFPRTASFRVRLRDNDSLTPLHRKASDQHNLLRSLIGKLLYIDARASPPEKIVWTLENLNAADDNSAVNAYDLTVTAREIIGGQFGEYVDPNELSIEKGLVPVEIVAQPTATGIGNQVLQIDLKEAQIRAQSNQDSDAKKRQVSGGEMYRLNYLSNYYEAHQGNFNAVADVSSGRTAQAIITKGPRDNLLKNPNHVMFFGSRLPQIVDCTLVKMEFEVLDRRFQIVADATKQLKALTISIEVPTYNDDGSPTGQTAFGNPVMAKPGVPYFFKAVGKDPQRNASSRRGDINFPEDMDAIILLGPDKEDREFSAKNLQHFSLLVCLIGGLPV